MANLHTETSRKWLYRSLFFLLSFLINCCVILTFKPLHESVLLVVSTVAGSFVLGLYLKQTASPSRPIIQSLAWGLMAGSMIVFLLTITLIACSPTFIVNKFTRLYK